MSQHIGPRTISAIGGSVKRVGNYRVHTFPSELVTDGLVLNLDAGDPRSYPSSGTTWTDLSGNGNNGTINSGSYDNSSGGSIVFNGTNTNVSFPSTNIPLINRSATLSVWFKIDSATGYQNIFDTPDATSNIRIAVNYQNVSNTLFAGFAVGTDLTTSYVAGTWYNLIVTGDNNIGTKLYLNGILVNSSTTKNVPAILDLNTARLGNVDGDRSNEWFDGNISVFQVYNRALSAAEVTQNYDALKVRYTTYTNTFTPLCGGGEGKVEVLCVAGGGGGGNVGGGGGAGGLIYNSAFAVDSNNEVSVSIGGGGAGAQIGSNTKGANGGNSTFSNLSSFGGGGGGSKNVPPASGGSGGGAGRDSEDNGASGTPSQGNSGGKALLHSSQAGGGGGGAGSPGENGTAPDTGSSGQYGGSGGEGLIYSISGNSKYYAAGGDGGQYVGGILALGGSNIGGTGGTGDGANNTGTPATNGSPNTGSGGGGGGGTNSGGANPGGLAGNGSNGTVIVRYPATDYNVELLIVAGGGGGGYCLLGDGGGGGGGAGGVIYYSSYPVSAGTKYSVTVGAGGTGSTVTDGTVNGSNGLNSTFNSLTAIGGGGGGSTRNSITLNVGGSGGGAGSDIGNDTGGFGTSGQGNNGGNNNTGSVGAGGGGAGAVGTSVTTGTDVPNGGVGLAYAITGTSTYYAGGGGGGKYSGGSGNAGTGGLGGGGNGGKGAAGSNGTANTGGGGGGGGGGFAGGNGGSGIIIIAYQGPQRGLGGTVDTTSRPGYTLHKFTTTGSDIFIP